MSSSIPSAQSNFPFSHSSSSTSTSSLLSSQTISLTSGPNTPQYYTNAKVISNNSNLLNNKLFKKTGLVLTSIGLIISITTLYQLYKKEINLAKIKSKLNQNKRFSNQNQLKNIKNSEMKSEQIITDQIDGQRRSEINVNGSNPSEIFQII